MICKEDKDHRSSRNKCLMVTALREDFSSLLIPHHKDGIKHLVACGRSTHCSMQDFVENFLGNFPIIVDSQRSSVVDDVKNGIAHKNPPFCTLARLKKNKSFTQFFSKNCGFQRLCLWSLVATSETLYPWKRLCG